MHRWKGCAGGLKWRISSAFAVCLENAAPIWPTASRAGGKTIVPSVGIGARSYSLIEHNAEVSVKPGSAIYLNLSQSCASAGGSP